MHFFVWWKVRSETKHANAYTVNAWYRASNTYLYSVEKNRKKQSVKSDGIWLKQILRTSRKCTVISKFTDLNQGASGSYFQVKRWRSFMSPVGAMTCRWRCLTLIAGGQWKPSLAKRATHYRIMTSQLRQKICDFAFDSTRMAIDYLSFSGLKRGLESDWATRYSRTKSSFRTRSMHNNWRHFAAICADHDSISAALKSRWNTRNRAVCDLKADGLRCALLHDNLQRYDALLRDNAKEKQRKAWRKLKFELSRA